MNDDILENQMAQQILEVAYKFRLLVYHPYNPIKDKRGFPDWTIISNSGELIFAELKSKRRKVTKEQKRWIQELRYAGCEAYVVRGRDSLKSLLTLMACDSTDAKVYLTDATQAELESISA